jgi:hypothetical protein
MSIIKKLFQVGWFAHDMEGLYNFTIKKLDGKSSVFHVTNYEKIRYKCCL